MKTITALFMKLLSPIIGTRKKKNNIVINAGETLVVYTHNLGVIWLCHECETKRGFILHKKFNRKARKTCHVCKRRRMTWAFRSYESPREHWELFKKYSWTKKNAQGKVVAKGKEGK